MRPTLQAILDFWNQNKRELGAVRKETYDELDRLIRADERAAMMRDLNISKSVDLRKYTALGTGAQP
jgi:hypothetical protein